MISCLVHPPSPRDREPWPGLRGARVERRPEGTAERAPRCPEHDDGRFRRAEDVAFELLHAPDLELRHRGLPRGRPHLNLWSIPSARRCARRVRAMRRNHFNAQAASHAASHDHVSEGMRMGPACSREMKEYFAHLQAAADACYVVARAARAPGFDPELGE